MRWLTVAGVLLYLTRCNDAGALKCHPGSQDPLCALEKKEISEPLPCKPHPNFKGLCSPKHNIVKRSPEEQCTPGTSFKRDCNTCHCLSDGKIACTKKGCVHLTSKRKREAPEAHFITKRSVCKPNSEFNVECNPCKCAANGLSYTCTHNECLEGDETNKEVEVFMETEGMDHIEQHSVCKPRATFYVGCNTCRCNFIGTDYSCTNKPCPLPKDVEIFHELKIPAKPSNSTRVVCIANRMFIKGCNTCWCNEDGTSYFCTRRVCIETPDDAGDPNQELQLRVVRKECKPHEIFEMDCNMCRCNEDGKSFSCTRRACVEMDEKNATSRSVRAAGTKTCLPGQQFRMDCNTCLCNDEGQDFSCTRNDCSAQNNNGGASGSDTIVARRKRDTTTRVPLDCVPGSVFDRECNVCRCTEDGKHAACTLKNCHQTSGVNTESKQEFRCTPGEQFKQDCNDCTCAADGLSVYCTLRLCESKFGEITE